jgi:hypothetical protein
MALLEWNTTQEYISAAVSTEKDNCLREKCVTTFYKNLYK